MKYRYKPDEGQKDIVLFDTFLVPLLLSKYMKDAYLSLEAIAHRIKWEHIEQWANNGFEVNGCEVVLEVKPTALNLNTPALFPDRKVTEGEEGNETIRTLKVNEYFRYWSVDGRSFIQITMNPKSGDSELGTLATKYFPSSLQINEIVTTFSSNILNKYSLAEFRVLLAEITITE